MAVEVGSAIGYLDLDTSKYMAGITEAEQAQNRFNKQSNTTSSTLSKFGGVLTSTGTALTKGLTVPIVGAGTGSVMCAAKFESSMSKVEAVSGQASNAVVKLANGSMTTLGDKAKQMGATTKFSASEAADAMYYMGLAGWGSKQMIEGLDGVMNLAAASGEDLASTSDIVTDSLTGFGLNAKDASHFADLLAKTSSSSNTTVALMGETFKYVAPVCGSLGYSAEDASIAIGLMANAGIKGSQAGTSLRAALINMVKPTNEMANTMEKLGINVKNEDGTMKSLRETLVMLREKFSGLSESEKANAAASIFGKEAMSGMLAIINASDEDFNNLVNSVDSCTGAAKGMADTMNDNLNGQLTILKSTIEAILIQFGDLMLPLIKKVVSALQGFATTITNLSDGQKEMIIRVASFVACLGPVLMIFGKLIAIGASLHSKFTILKGGFEAIKLSIAHVGEAFSLARAGLTGFASQTSVLGAALGGLTAPILAIIALIALLVAAFVHLWKTNEEFRNKITGILDEIKQRFQQFTQNIVDKINELGFNFKDITEVIKAIWDTFCKFFAPVFTAAFQEIADILNAVFGVIEGIFDVFVGIFTGDWEQAWNGIVGIFGSIFGLLIDTVSNTLNAFGEIVNVFLGLFGTSWQEIWTGICDFFVNIWNGIATFFSDLWNGITSVVSTAWETIKNLVTLGIMAVKGLFTAAFEILTIPFRFIWENCKGIVEKVFNAISGFISKVLGTIKTTFSTVWNAIKGVIDTVLGAIKGVVTSVWIAISDKTKTVWTGIKTTIGTIWEGIKTKVSSVIESIKKIVSAAWRLIKTYIVNPISQAKDAVASAFDRIKNKISSVMENAKSLVSNAMNKIKGFFNVKLSFPKIKLPHFKVTGKLSLNPPSVPKFDVDWYKKAMSGGMILNSATIFGYDQSTGKFLGGGEAGSETVVGTNNLMNMIKNSVAEAFSDLIAMVKGSQTAEAVGDIIIPVYIGNEMIDEMVVTATNRKDYRSGGR